MSSTTSISVEDRSTALRARIDRGRAYAENIFENLREREAAKAIIPAISREEQLAAMLSRIKVNLPGVVYGTATEGVSLQSGLPAHLQPHHHTV